MRRSAALGLALALAGCGVYRPATVRAAAVALGAFGTGAATAGQTCSDQPWSECRQVALTGLIVSTGLALSAGAVAFLEAEDERARDEQPDAGAAR